MGLPKRIQSQPERPTQGCHNVMQQELQEVASCWNTQMKPPHLRQPASAEFNNENSPPNRMVAVVHGLLIANQDQTELN